MAEKLTSENYCRLDELVLGRQPCASEEDRDLLVKYAAEIRDKVFEVAKSVGFDIWEMQNTSCCIGSAVEITGFLDELIERIKDGTAD